MRKIMIRLALVGAGAAVLAGSALAQVPPPPAPPAPPPPPEAPLPLLPPLPPMDMTMAMGPDTMFLRQDRHADPEKRAQRLRDILQLRPDQDAVLKTYVEATTPKFEIKQDVVIKNNDGGKGEWTEPKPPTTLERLDRMTKAADAMKKRAEATRAFYTALTPAQQKTFDILGMGEGVGDQHIFVRRFETGGAPAVFKGGDRKIVIERKVG